MKNIIWRVLTVAFVIRLLVPVIAFIHNQSYEGFHSNDTRTYIEPARALIAYGRFASPIDGSPELRRTPGYPLFLIPGILLNSTDWVTIALQIILSCLTVYLVYKIALLLFDKVKVATICALLYTFEPLSIMYNSKIMAETVFAFVNTLFIYYFLKYLDSRFLKHLLISAIALVASTYVRPINYYLPFLITGIIVIWFITKMRHHKILLVHSCAFLIVSMGLIGIWQVRNKVVAGYPGFCAITDYNMYFYKAPALLAVKNGTTFFQEQDKRGLLDAEITQKTYLQNHPEQRSWSQSERYQYMGKEGAKIVKGNSLIYAIMHLKGMMRVMVTPGTGEYTILFQRKEDPAGMYTGAAVENTIGTIKNLFLKDPLFFWLSVLLALSLYSYLLFALIGLISSKGFNDIRFITLLSICAYFITVSGGPEGQSRFRHPIMPIICILAGYGLSVIIDRIGKKSTEKDKVLT